MRISTGKPRRSGLALVSVLLASLLLGMANLGAVLAAQSFASPDFENVWNRTDKQVANGSLSRTFLWGPEPFTAGVQEDYAEAPGGKRLVQYFDKSRMEITKPDGDKSSPYYVTNGLIARELMSGQLQLGDNKFETRAPSTIGVAGDADDTNGPTYKVLGGFTAPASNALNQPIAKAVDRAGNLRDAAGEFGQYNVTYTNFEPLTGHNIAKPFWDFLNQSGQVLDSAGKTITGRLFDPVYYATGLPITEGYWAKVKVAGQVKDVLVQAFERRVLTYTPSNPNGYQVEMGNVGRHYYDWRYNTPVTPPPTTTPPPQTATCDNTPAGTNGGYSFLKCGPAGMEVFTVAPMQANEVVAVTMVQPNGKTVSFTDKKAQGDGTVFQGIITYPNTTLGRYVVKFEGKTSGKKAEADFFLQPPVSAPTIIVNPSPGKLDQLIVFVIVGFDSETPLRLNIRNPDAKDANAATSFDTTQGGGLTLGFIASRDFPPDLAKAGTWFISAVDTKNEKIFATANFVLNK